jgi:LuxR family transcriptional regulator, maltose regulon positive regulatory protein
VSADVVAALVDDLERPDGPESARANAARLPDGLTDAELRAPEALPLRLTYADMAAQLHLSLNTVKAHLRHSYMKVDVTSRAAAVERATALG